MTNQSGTLTVVMPTFNHAPYIRTAVDSVIAQTRRPDRLIIIDDASRDGTPAIIADYAERYPWIEIVTNPENQGVIACLNAGFAMVDSEYVTFFASDDFVMPDLYDKTLQLLEAHPGAGLCAVLARWVDESGRPVRQPRPVSFGRDPRYIAPDEIVQALMRHGSIFNGGGTIYRSDSLRAVGGFDVNLGSFCDGYAVQVISLRDGACYVPEVLMVWRRLTTSYATNSQADLEACRAAIKAICRRLWQIDAATFPVAYRGRLERRVRFSLAAAAAETIETDREAMAEALGANWKWLCPLLALVCQSLGCSVAKALLMIILRPWDVFPVFARRVFAWPESIHPIMPQD